MSDQGQLPVNMRVGEARTGHHALVAGGLAALMSLPSTANANMPLDWAIEAAGLPTIPFVVAVEWLFLWWLFDLSATRAFLASIVVNLATYIIGFMTVPQWGIVLFDDVFIDALERMADGEAIALAFGLAALLTVLDALVELGLLRYGFKQKMTCQRVIGWTLVNFATVAGLFAMMGFFGPTLALGTD